MSSVAYMYDSVGRFGVGVFVGVRMKHSIVGYVCVIDSVS